MSGEMSGPRGWSSHSGASTSSSGIHQTMGSDECCRYTTFGAPLSARRPRRCRRTGPRRRRRRPGPRPAWTPHGPRQPAPDRVGERRPDQQDAVRAGGRPVRLSKVRSVPYEPRLSPKSTSSAASPGSIGGPSVVHGGDQRVRGLGPRLVDHERQPAGQVRVLHRDQRGVAAVHVLQRGGDFASTHPVPVAVTTPSTARSNAPVRSSSDRERRTLPRRRRRVEPRVDPDRLLSRSPGEPVESHTVGAVATNDRPCRPSSSQATADPSLPERRNDVGAVTPSAVCPLVSDAVWLTTATRLPHSEFATTPKSR